MYMALTMTAIKPVLELVSKIVTSKIITGRRNNILLMGFGVDTNKTKAIGKKGAKKLANTPESSRKLWAGYFLNDKKSSSGVMQKKMPTASKRYRRYFCLFI